MQSNNGNKTEWNLVRVPSALHDRLRSLADQFLQSHEHGYSALPEEFCEHVPLHFVIKRGVDEIESHRERSRRSRRTTIGRDQDNEQG